MVTNIMLLRLNNANHKMKMHNGEFLRSRYKRLDRRGICYLLSHSAEDGLSREILSNTV